MDYIYLLFDTSIDSDIKYLSTVNMNYFGGTPKNTYGLLSQNPSCYKSPSLEGWEGWGCSITVASSTMKFTSEKNKD